MMSDCVHEYSLQGQTTTTQPTMPEKVLQINIPFCGHVFCIEDYTKKGDNMNYNKWNYQRELQLLCVIKSSLTSFHALLF